MLASGGTLVSIEIMLARHAGNVQQENLLGDAAAVAAPGNVLEGPINLLLFGIDEQGEGARADTIIVLARHQRRIGR